MREEEKGKYRYDEKREGKKQFGRDFLNTREAREQQEIEAHSREREREREGREIEREM